MADGGIIAEFAFALGLVDNASKPLDDVAEKAEDTAGKASSAWGNAGKAIGASMLAIGAAVVGAGAAMFALVDKSTKAGDAIAKGARAAGLGVIEYQRLAHAAELSDVSAELLTRGIQDLNRNLSDAGDGGAKDFVESLGTIGVDVANLRGTASENLGAIFDALNEVEDPAIRSAKSIEIFGKSGRQMASLIAEGSDGIREAGDELERFGAISEEQAAQSEAFQDSLTSAEAAIGSFANQIGIAAAPALQDLIDDTVAYVAANDDMIQQDAAEAFRDMSEAAHALLPALQSVGTVVSVISEAIGGLALVVEGVGNAVEDLVENPTIAGFTPIGFAARVAEGTGQAIDDKLVSDQERFAARDEARVERAARASLDAQRESLTAARRLLRRPTPPKVRGGGKRREQVADFDAEDFEELEAEELLGEDIDRLARQVGASDAQRQEALSAAARSLAGNASASVALKAAKSRLESLTGATLRDKESDPILSEIFGEDIPDVQLSQLALGAQPQTLIATINNSFAFDVRQEINGAGNPTEVASQVNRQIVEVWENAVEKSTKLAKVRFRR